MTLFIMFIVIAFPSLLLLAAKWLDYKDNKAQQEHISNMRFRNAINKIEGIDEF